MSGHLVWCSTAFCLVGHPFFPTFDMTWRESCGVQQTGRYFKNSLPFALWVCSIIRNESPCLIYWLLLHGMLQKKQGTALLLGLKLCMYLRCTTSHTLSHPTPPLPAHHSTVCSFHSCTTLLRVVFNWKYQMCLSSVTNRMWTVFN